MRKEILEARLKQSVSNVGYVDTSAEKCNTITSKC